MKKRILTAVLAGAFALSACAAMSGCGDDKDKDKKTPATTASTQSTTVAATTANSDSENETNDSNISSDTQSSANGYLTTIPPADEQAVKSAGNYITDAALNAAGYSSADGYYGSVYSTYVSSGVTYYFVTILNSNNILQTMIWVSEDGVTTYDSETFYNTFILPDISQQSSDSDQPATYWIIPSGPDGAEAGDEDADSDEDNTVAPYQE